MATKPHRHIMRIELRPTAKKILETTHEKLGMTQVSMMSRVVEWFATQPHSIQAAVVGVYPEEFKVEIAKLVLEHMAKGGGK